jgi:anti-sigma factor ChrR (cupin superfamily)
MLERLERDEKQPGRPRTVLDQQLQTREWRAPGKRVQRKRVDTPNDAPAWWKGDEDASQTFLHNMGIVMTDGSKT